MLSTLWSPSPALTFIKGFELALILVTAVISILLLHSYGIKAEVFIARSASMLVVVMLGINIITSGTPLKLFETEEARTRVTLAFNHPLASADILALVIILLFTLNIKFFTKAALVSSLAGGLILTDGRAPIAALSLTSMAILFVGWPMKYKLMVGLFIGSGVVSFLLWDSFQGLTEINSAYTSIVENRNVNTLNNRVGLWSVAATFFLENPFTGVGYYSTRFFLLDYYGWAGQAHNAFIEVAMSTGIFGLALSLLFLLFALKLALGNRLLLAVLIYTLLRSLFAPLLFSPSFPMVIVVLLIASSTLHQLGASDSYPISPRNRRRTLLRLQSRHL
jgi:O-antigen ligase